MVVWVSTQDAFLLLYLFVLDSSLGFVGASTSMNFSRIARNGSSPFPDEYSPSDLTEEDIDSLRTELAKVMTGDLWGSLRNLPASSDVSLLNQPLFVFNRIDGR